MPSFLNKVFGHKKHDDGARSTREPSEPTLLDGKSEPVSPVHSPSASTFPDLHFDLDGTFSFFKPKPRGASQKPLPHSELVPHLTLHLPDPKEGADARERGVVFEADPDSELLLDDAVIAAKRLSPIEAIVLVRFCAQAIAERGLETLGIMHPHWFSASPDAQRKLISLFIRSLTPQNQPTTLSSKPPSPITAFENELLYTRSSHDVAAVLRWGLRHLSLENGHFGKDNTEWAWYDTFFNAERRASYPPKAFSELLLPRLPVPHIELLAATLNLVSSLASHAEANGISGSKLSKFLGFWLLVPTRAEPSDDWHQFYARWERAGRILEHLFLARLREESLAQRLPTRLEELVKHYPYKGSPSTDDDLLPRPRFSTRHYDALLVRVESLLANGAAQPKKHPIQLLLDAFQLPVENPCGDAFIALWNTLKRTASEQAGSSDSDGLQFTRIFVDETIQLLALLPADNNISTSPILLNSPFAQCVSRKRSSSPIKTPRHGNGSIPVSPTSPSTPAIADWAQFSLSGFGDTATAQPLATLLDPSEGISTQLSRKSSRQRGKSRTRRRRSQDHSSPQFDLDAILETKLASAHVVQIDEAFIDFWSDAIVDPISSDWPTFLICGLKQIPNVDQPIRWLIIEQAYGHQQSQTRHPSPDGRRGRSPRPSFKSDISGFRINSMFSSARKRLSVFSKSVTDLDLRKSGGKSPITGELGEILVEEDPTCPPVPPRKGGGHAGNAAVGATIPNDTAANVADQLKANEISIAPITGILPPDRVPTSKPNSDSIRGATKAPSVEPAPQSGGSYNYSATVKASEDVAVVEQGSQCALDSVAQTTRAHVSNALSVIEADDPPVHGDEPVLAKSTDELSNAAQVGSQELAQAVAMPPAPNASVTTPVAHLAAATAVDEKASEVVAEESIVPGQPSSSMPADPVAASTVEWLGQPEKDDLASQSTTQGPARQANAIGTQLAPDSAGSTVDAIQEVEGDAEAASRGCGGAVQVPAAEPEPLENAVGSSDPQADVASPAEAGGDAVPRSVAAELKAVVNASSSNGLVGLARDAASSDIMSVEPEHTADHVSGLATEEATTLRGTDSHETAEVPHLQEDEAEEARAVPEAGVEDAVREPQGVLAGVHTREVTLAGVNQAQDDVGVPTPVPQTPVWVHETPGGEDVGHAFQTCDVPGPSVPAVDDESIVEEAPAHVEVGTRSTSEPASVHNGDAVPSSATASQSVDVHVHAGDDDGHDEAAKHHVDTVVSEDAPVNTQPEPSQDEAVPPREVADVDAVLADPAEAKEPVAGVLGESTFPSAAEGVVSANGPEETMSEDS